MKFQKQYFRIIILCVGILIMLIPLFWWFQSRLDEQLEDSVNMALLQASSEQAYNFHSKMQSEMELLETLALLMPYIDNDSDKTLKFMKSVSGVGSFNKIGIASPTGECITGDGKVINVLQREYFKEAMQGKTVFSEEIVSMLTNEGIIVLATPIYSDDEIKSVLLGSYPATKLNDLFVTSSFGGKGYTYVVNAKGQIVASSTNEYSMANIENLFSFLANTEFYEGGSLSKIKDDIAHMKQGNVRYSYEGKDRLIAYTPLKFNDWYIFSIVPKEVVSVQSEIISKNVYRASCIIVFGFFALIFYIMKSQNQHTKELTQLAFTDKLTNIRNLDKFVIDSKEYLKKQNNDKCLLIKMDINEFKLINHIFGFEIGNKILKNMAKTLDYCVGDNGIYGRVSSDNFVVLAKYENDDEVEKYKNEFFIKFSQNNMEFISDYKIDFSVGICKWDGIESPEKMIEKATIAQKIAKDMPKNQLSVYEESMREGALRDKRMENTMHQALKDRDFAIYVQPKYDIVTREISGGEALIRWKHKTDGIILPVKFIPLFEKNGFIIPIDLFVLEEICKLQQKNIEAGKKLIPISVNQSKVLIAEPNYVDTVLEIVKAYGIPSNLIELELTETIINDNMSLLKAISKRLLKEGFIISIDDFGTGYSSLNLLKEIPASILKIDREFLNDSLYDERSYIILENMIRLAKDLKMIVITEGIETKEQENLLKKLGCNMGQGYLYAKPMEMEEFEKLL